MSSSHIQLGKRGEDLATEFLLQKGYKIIERNFRAKQYGEVDLIVQKGNTLIFVEVKSRIGNEFGEPFEAVGFRKLRELKKMVAYYFALNPSSLSPRIDVLAISFDQNLTVQKIEHLENVTM